VVLTQSHDEHGDSPDAAGTAGTAHSAHLSDLDSLTASCVHCGFCLPACPTYALTGDENDSPRGRIHLARQVVTGQAPLDAAVAGHIDSCLGCLACVPACPSGVRYDRIIEEFRPEVEEAHAAERGDQTFRRLVFALFPHPNRLRVAALGAILYRRTGLRALVHATGVLRRFPRLAAMEALMPPVTARAAWSRLPRRTEPSGERRRTVGLIQGCVQRVFFADVNAATIRVLTAEGCAVTAPRQGCCGALSLHAGRDAEAKAYARAMIDAFDADLTSCDAIVVNVAGCGSTLKGYGELLADDPGYAAKAETFAAKVRDVSEVLAGLEPRAPRHPINAKVAYHDACHLSHGQGVRAQPRAVLASIPGIELVEPTESGFCCGSAGIHNLVRPEAAAELGRRKAERISATDPELVATGNPGCLLQIQRYLDERSAEQGGTRIRVLHPVELVDASIRGTPVKRRG
jgi:glycolate oxidase iron-sulfur subunit